ncbi:MAG: T9SS type A sorting domain-containing protein [Polaribacter sp.]|nr:T9SS type A sorting domain-containing protein [Polaribacter sp.]
MKKIALLLFICIGLSLHAQKKLSSTLTESFDGSTWQNSDKIEYNYEANGNVVEEIEFFWQTSESQWTAANKISYNYNTHNKVIVALNEEFDADTNSFKESSRTNYTYNSSGYLTQFLDQDWSGSTWENSSKTDLTYNGNLVSGGLSYEWVDNNWSKVENVTIVYNDNETIKSFALATWDGSGWVDESGINFSYDGGDNLISKVRYAWNGSAFEDDSKTEYIYDTNGNIISEKEFDFDNGNFELDSEETAAYDTSELMSDYVHPYSDKSGIDYLTDPFGLINKILNTTATDSDRITYNYNETTASITEFGSTALSVYPNPVSSFIKVDDSSFSISNMTIFNLIGQKLLSTIENKLNIENLDNGVYLLKVETVSGKYFTKRILKK